MAIATEALIVVITVYLINILGDIWYGTAEENE